LIKLANYHNSTLANWHFVSLVQITVMEFGRVTEAELANINFSLPAEPAANQAVLPGKASQTAKIYLGCTRWGSADWAGKIYPPKTKEKDFLQHYVKHYNSIELNATHYKIYGPAAIAKWAALAKGKDFKFCPKMYQGVTHQGSLQGKTAIINEFLQGILAFEENLGPCFVQLSDAFGPGRKQELFDFMASLPTDMPFFLELRHPDWFVQPDIRQELFNTLRQLNIGAVITDTAGRRDCAHMELTVPKTIIRFVGNSLHPTDYTRADAWIKRMQYWLSKGMEELYFFMHMHDEALSPELTVYMVDKLNAVGGYNLLKPQFVQQQQQTLF
jgi:uncharacterized protein YecE (DUF72 family)